MGDDEKQRGTELPGADATELGRMLRAAAATGLPQVSHSSHNVEDRAVGREIIEAIAGQMGAAEAPRVVEPDELHELEREVRETLRREGIDPDAGEPA